MEGICSTATTATTSSSPSSSSIQNFAGHSHDCDKSNSRRSVDWRDSGIVIDEELHLLFNSIDGICSINSTTSLEEQYQQQPQPSSGCSQTIVDQHDDDGDTILHLAVVGCTMDKMEDLIKICDLDAINNLMHTPMHVATMANRPEMVGLLLKSGAKICVQDRKGNTPLHMACQKGRIEIVTIILDHIIESSGRSIEKQQEQTRKHIEMANFDGQTCLHLAAANERYDLLDTLIKRYNADINFRDSRSGETIIHRAINKFNVNVVKFLLSFEQHCNQTDYSGRSPLDTVEVLRESRIDSFQAARLEQIRQLVKDRIDICIQRNGCCARNYPNKLHVNEILDSPLSSDYSDSDGY